MVGIGLTPEGLADSYITQDLMLEMSWRQKPVEDLAAWVANYTARRYGSLNPAASQSYQVRKEEVLSEIAAFKHCTQCQCLKIIS